MSTIPERPGPPAGAVRDGLQAGFVAALVSSVPSTVYSIAAHRDPLEATIAAGSMVLPHENRRAHLVGAAIPVHFALSALWGVVLALVMPRRRPLVTGTLAGLAIGLVDLRVIGRRFPMIRDLPLVPQLADHVAFGITVAAKLHGSRHDN